MQFKYVVNIPEYMAVGAVVSNLAFHTGDQGSSPGQACMQFRLMPKMEVHTCYKNQKVTAASV